jgi:pimeloyl-ACP methyl ester carboxylesterase
MLELHLINTDHIVTGKGACDSNASRFVRTVSGGEQSLQHASVDHLVLIADQRDPAQILVSHGLAPDKLVGTRFWHIARASVLGQERIVCAISADQMFAQVAGDLARCHPSVRQLVGHPRGSPPAHLAGIGVGGMVAQVAALDHPDAFSALTLAGSRPVAPRPVDDDLPDHDAATMDRLFSRVMPDWSDRAAVAQFAAGGAEILGDDPAAARATAGRIWDRTPGTEPAVQMANQMGMVFSKLDGKPRWRERLPELAIPALVVHGRRDPFFPVGNGEALAREIPGARLLVLERAATAIPDAAADEVASAMLAF